MLVNSECGIAKTSNAEGIRFVTVPQIEVIGMPQVRVSVVGCDMRLVDNYMHFCAIRE